VLVQSEQLGTSVAKTLRVHSDTLRTQRRQRVEEQAAKTTVKLVFPLVFFIFPSLFLVTLGPAAIVMSESFQKYFN
jgi:tight adherence protein C